MTPDAALLDDWMGVALEEAERALAHDDVPVGAVVVHGPTRTVVACRHNERELHNDPTAHAEVLALRDAAATAGWRLSEHVLIVTIEPCVMCAGAAWAARVPTIVFGAPDPKAGASGSLYNFGADPRLNHNARIVPGVRAQEAAALLQRFFDGRR